jgi:hypothetical protein
MPCPDWSAAGTSAGGVWNGFTCSLGGAPICEPGTTYLSPYDICMKYPSTSYCPPYFELNATRPANCIPFCPPNTGARRVARSGTNSQMYCASSDVPYDQAAASGLCFSMPPPSPPKAPVMSPPPQAPIRVCTLPPVFNVTLRKCPNGALPCGALRGSAARLHGAGATADA